MKFKIEQLEERIAPSVGLAATMQISYSGGGLMTPGTFVPQELISGSGFDSNGRADFDGALVRVFGHTP